MTLWFALVDLFVGLELYALLEIQLFESLSMSWILVLRSLVDVRLFRGPSTNSIRVLHSPPHTVNATVYVVVSIRVEEPSEDRMEVSERVQFQYG